MRKRRTDRAALAALLALAAVAPAQQEPAFAVDVAIAPQGQRAAAPALAWLCEDWLPRQPGWPEGLDSRDGLRLHLGPDGVRVAPLGLALDPSTAALGSCTVRGGASALFLLAADGVEDWYVPERFAPPEPWRRLLTQLDALAVDRPRTLDVGVVVGHLAGGLLDADQRAELLQLGASQCGETTWLAWRTPEWLRVRGRSGGGLALPAALMLLAQTDGRRTDGLALRAFAARDADRAEAARQMLRTHGRDTPPPLRAALFADDATRLAAIDTLVRRRATGELSAIVAAADADSPWATLAAADALRALWPFASPAERQRTRAALQRCTSPTLRTLQFEPSLPGPDDLRIEPAPAQVRGMIWLALLGVLLTGLWARERARLAVAAPAASGR